MVVTNPEAKRARLTNRYIFSGRLVMQTALHIGGGRASLSSSNSPVVLTPEGRPFIPGSSFKGALRSSVEKLVPSLPAQAQLSTCSLIELSKEQKKEAKARHEILCSSLMQDDIANQRRADPANQAIMEEARENLCSTCQLFGSPFAASLLSVQDLYISGEIWEGGLVQQRDGVAINRDSETARSTLKYDFEVVPALTTFDLRITLENASISDLQLISVGLSEFVNGFGNIGGKRSRGLGACELQDLTVFILDLEKAQDRSSQLRNHLLKRPLPEKDGSLFLEEQIDSIFSATEV